MRVQTIALIAAVSAVALGQANPTQSCTAGPCDDGFCCSSSGFCGRSLYHCSQASGCNPEKGSCGVVVLDKQDLPRVISYDQLGKSSASDLAKKLAEEGSHLSAEDTKQNMTVEMMLQNGMSEKGVIHSGPGNKTLAGGSPLTPLPSDSNKNNTTTPMNGGSRNNAINSKNPDNAHVNGAASKSVAISGSMGAVLGLLAWLV